MNRIENGLESPDSKTLPPLVHSLPPESGEIVTVFKKTVNTKKASEKPISCCRIFWECISAPFKWLIKAICKIFRDIFCCPKKSKVPDSPDIPDVLVIPNKKSVSQFNTTGLPNFGSTCFANTALQMIAGIPGWVEELGKFIGEDELLNPTDTTAASRALSSLQEKIRGMKSALQGHESILLKDIENELDALKDYHETARNNSQTDEVKDYSKLIPKMYELESLLMNKIHNLFHQPTDNLKEIRTLLQVAQNFHKEVIKPFKANIGRRCLHYLIEQMQNHNKGTAHELRKLLDLFWKIPHLHDLLAKNQNGGASKDSSLSDMFEMIEALTLQNRFSTTFQRNRKEFQQQIEKVPEAKFNTHTEYDPSEFLSCLLDTLMIDSKPGFAITTAEQFSGTVEGSQERLEKDVQFHPLQHYLPLKGVKPGEEIDIQTLINRQTGKESLNPDKNKISLNDSSNLLADTKSEYLALSTDEKGNPIIPEMFVVTMPMWHYDKKQKKSVKMDKHILKLTERISFSAVYNANANSLLTRTTVPPTKPEDLEKTLELTYEPFYIGRHNGSIGSGHHYGFRKEDTRWIQYNDKEVKPVKASKVEGEASINGYLVAYRLVPSEVAPTEMRGTPNSTSTDPSDCTLA